MGWKKVKEHYNIGHIVQVTSKGICIGSAYVHNIIVIADGAPRWDSALRSSNNTDLARYFSEMNADLTKLQELINAPDEFEESIPVYTYDGAEIIEKKCEELGWPNITHDGEIMHDNTFSDDRDTVLKWALENAKAGVEIFSEQVTRIQGELQERKDRLRVSQYNVASLEKQIAETA